MQYYSFFLLYLDTPIHHLLYNKDKDVFVTLELPDMCNSDERNNQKLGAKVDGRPREELELAIPTYPSGLNLVFIFVALCLTVLVALVSPDTEPPSYTFHPTHPLTIQFLLQRTKQS